MRARMLAWAMVLPLLKRRLAAERLVRLMHHEPGARRATPEETARIIRLAAWSARNRPLPGRDNCLERSLLAYRYLGRAGARPRLAMGVRREQDGVTGHAWIILEGRAVDDGAQDGSQPFATVVEFDADGRAIGSSVGAALAGADWDR